MAYSVKVYDVKDSWEINTSSVQRIDYSESIGLKLPMMQVTISTLSDIKKVILIGQKVNIEFFVTSKKIAIKNMEIVDIRSRKDISENKPEITTETLTINLVYDYKKWVRDTEIKSYRDKGILEVLKDYGFKSKTIKEDVAKQTWIRSNESIKKFVRKLITHTYLGEKDIIVSSITSKGSFVESLKLATEKEDIKLADYISDERYFVEIEGVNTDIAIKMKRVKPKSVVVVEDMLSNTIKVLDYQGKEVGNREGFTLENYQIKDYLIDCGNVYDGYYKGMVRNYSGWIALRSDTILVKTNQPYNKELDILSVVDLDTKNPKSAYKGKWIVISSHISSIPNSGGMLGFYTLARVDKKFFDVMDGK